jgi:uncharacterized protein YjbI with pentapeptide repeats
LNFFHTADLIFPCIPLGYTFGRLGNFINGELYGRVTTHPIGMYFPQAGGSGMRHPSQLYEAFFEGIVLFVLLWLLRRRVNLSGAMLCGADLSGADLSGADLRQADLRGANLQGATLAHANLQKSDFSRADLRNANLTKADVCWALMTGTDTRGASMRGAVRAVRGGASSQPPAPITGQWRTERHQHARSAA